MTDFRTIAAVAAGLALSLGGVASAQSAGDEPRYVSSQDLTAKVAKTKEGLATFWLPTGPGGSVVLAHRDAPGHAEIHGKLNDEFVAKSGHAEVLVGGRLDGGQETAPNEWRGGTIVGGKVYAMGPGDVLWIPAGMPHRITPKGGDFTYLAFKYDLKTSN